MAPPDRKLLLQIQRHKRIVADKTDQSFKIIIYLIAPGMRNPAWLNRQRERQRVLA